MAEYKLVMPKMGESVFEATILSWHKKPGDSVKKEETVLEVATDKVDTDVPSPVEGVIRQLFFEEGDTVEVGKVLALIETEHPVEQPDLELPAAPAAAETMETTAAPEADVEPPVAEAVEAAPVTRPETPPAAPPAAPVNREEKPAPAAPVAPADASGRYYSPLVLNMAQTEGIPLSELEQIRGSGKGGRVTKEDMAAYIGARKAGKVARPQAAVPAPSPAAPAPRAASAPVRGDEIIEMDRMRKLIAKHMVDSRRTSAHVSSFIEADMTRVVRWRDKHKDAFFKREGFKLTFMPVFVEAIVQAIQEYPMINVSVDGDNIIVKKDINIGIATALPSGNLIVPVIKKAGQLNLTGIAHAMNDLVNRARSSSLKPDDTMGGTYTITNVGSFGNILGTPIINQPQVAIMAVGAIQKKPAVLETPEGDVIAIRHKMYLSHTYDHRVVDGMLGGLFVQRVAQILEGWDEDREW